MKPEPLGSWQTRATQGYTFIEVLMAVAITSIGLTAVVGIQVAAVRTNLVAQDMSEADILADRVLEVIRSEAATWNVANQLPSTPFLANLPGTFLEGDSSPWLSYAAERLDRFGRTHDTDLGSDSAAQLLARYCAFYRLTWLGGAGDMARVDVRIAWPRTPDENNAEWTQCQAGFFDDPTELATVNVYFYSTYVEVTTLNNNQ